LLSSVSFRDKIDNGWCECLFGSWENVGRHSVGGKNHFQSRWRRRDEWRRFREIIDDLRLIIDPGGFGDGWKIVVDLFLRRRRGRQGLANVVESDVEPVELDRFRQKTHCARLISAVLRRPGGDENDARLRILGENVATSGAAIQFRHSIIHQDEIGFVCCVAVDRFQTGAHHRDDVVSAPTDHIGERSSEAALVVGDQDTHMN